MTQETLRLVGTATFRKKVCDTGIMISNNDVETAWVEAVSTKFWSVL